MDQSDAPRELERKIEQAARIASRVSDQTTVERLRAWIDGPAFAAAPSDLLRQNSVPGRRQDHDDDHDDED